MRVLIRIRVTSLFGRVFFYRDFDPVFFFFDRIFDPEKTPSFLPVYFGRVFIGSLIQINTLLPVSLVVFLAPDVRPV